MKNVLSNLNPKLVFKYFEEISMIPRGSGNETEISNYLKSFGENLNLETIQDEHLNIIIRKPATKGYENSPGVILQGHMDMVCEKNKNTNHDFMKDPLNLRIDGDYIYATDTTLGADNGIAVAMGMAVLASNDIEHPQIEVLITSDEEAGMSGAMGLDGSHLSGKYIINLDSEEEGFLLVSCAGGATAKSSLNVNFVDTKDNTVGLSVEIKGLLGGHSGMDIIKQRGNSNKLMGRLLNLLTTDYDISFIDGGSKNNAIPRECECRLSVNKDNIDKIKSEISNIEKLFKNEYKTSDSSLEIVVGDCEINKVMNSDSKNKLISILNLIPNGIQTMSMDIENLVESSTNLGVVKTIDNMITFECAVRSSVSSLKDNILNQMSMLCENTNAQFDVSSSYPAWEYAKDSELEKICINTYKNLTGNAPVIMAIHAGLECGLLLDKIPGAEAISLGPNMHDVHTPNEHISIKSTENTWTYLLEILKSMK